MAERVERPDLEKLLAEFESSQHQYRTTDGYRLARAIAYTLQVEQDAAGLRAALAEMRQEARNLWVIAHGDNCCWEDECKRPGRECQWPMPALLGARE